MAALSTNIASRLLKFISGLLKSLWLFFPGILFLLFTISCFWLLGQGKDIIVAFTENESRFIYIFNYTRIIFFMAIGFWVYVSWYSSRIISYIKKSEQEDEIKKIYNSATGKEIPGDKMETDEKFVEPGLNFLDEFPRLIGNGCFLVLELAVLQSPALYSPISDVAAWIIFVVALILLGFLNSWIQKSQAVKPSFRKIFWSLIALLLVLVTVASVFKKINLYSLLGLLILFHIVFIFYINLRRVEIENETVKAKARDAVAREKMGTKKRTWFEKLMDYFCIPRKETGYFKWFLYIGIGAIVCYVSAIISLGFARGIGPFPFIILAFAVLLAFGNIVTAFSVKYNINFHFLTVVVAMLFGLKETHNVKTVKLDGGDNNYSARPQLNTFLTAWLNDRNIKDSGIKNYDVYFVMANGGASRSAYWTASVLGRIEDSSLVHHPENRFSDHVFCLSGTSGGGVGVAAFFSMLRNKQENKTPWYAKSAQAFLKQDYFTYTFARMLGPDFFNYIVHFSSVNDRAAALEKSFEESSLKNADTVYRVPFYDSLSRFPAMSNGKTTLPILFVNTTRMQDGNPGVVTNLKLDSGIFNNRVDVLGLLEKDKDITITSGAILGARFPYLSPAGRIANNYFVDGGYFDNSGAGVVQEIIRGIVNLGREDFKLHGDTGNLYRQVNKLHFKILHITNSPVDLDSNNIKSVSPIKNDLLAPVLTIVGAYDMQTTVNDSRLINFINDINNYTGNNADYTQIPLYKDSIEWKQDILNGRFDKEPPYAMNWFMSDTTLRRIDKRLFKHRVLDSLINDMDGW